MRCGFLMRLGDDMEGKGGLEEGWVVDDEVESVCGDDV